MRIGFSLWLTASAALFGFWLVVDAAPEYPDASDEVQTVSASPNEDIVVFTNDSGRAYIGCDAVSVFRAAAKSAEFHGNARMGPSRLAATADLSLIFATSDQNGELYSAISGAGPLPSRKGVQLSSTPRASEFAGIAVTGDSEFLLVGTMTAPYCSTTIGERDYHVSKFSIDEIDFDAGRLGPERGRFGLRGPAAEIILSDRGKTAHIVSVPFRIRSGSLALPEVITLDVETMTEAVPRVQLESISVPPPMCFATAFTPIGVTHASISPDERFLVTNRWLDSGLNVVDLEGRRSWTLDTDSRRGSWTGGVSFSHGPLNHGLLAVHGIDHVSVYDFGDGSRLTEVMRKSVTAPVVVIDGGVYGSSGGTTGPPAAINWSWSGELVIAAVSTQGRIEFQSWRADNDIGLVNYNTYEVCTQRENQQGDILTGNHVLPTPTLTMTSTPTHTPTYTPTSTPLPSSTITATNVPPTNTTEPTPTATSAPLPVFVPIALAERCDPARVRADVALVLDASSSMAGDKLAAAKWAAKAFIGAMDLPEDQVGVAAFSRESRIIHGLSGNEPSLFTSIDALDTLAGTRIDQGLEAGLEILEDSRAESDVTPVIVLLTDGLQEAAPEAPGLVAARIRGAGITLNVIGLGDDVNAEYLRSLVASVEQLHLSPDPRELEAIYTRIALTIPCPADSFWGRR